MSPSAKTGDTFLMNTKIIEIHTLHLQLFIIIVNLEHIDKNPFTSNLRFYVKHEFENRQLT